MSESIPQVSEHLKTVFEHDAPRLARQHGLRNRVFTATTLACVLVLGWLQNGQAGTSWLARFAGIFELQVHKQHVEAHLTQRTADWLLDLLRAAVWQMVQSQSAVSLPLLQRFRAVWIEDSSQISLPAALAQVWRGCGGNSAQSSAPRTEAGVKVMVRWNLASGGMQGPFLHAARTHDREGELAEQPMAPGSLWIADLGYFALSWLQQLMEQGIFFLMRLKDPITLWCDGERVDLLAFLRAQGQQPLDGWVELEAKRQIRARLLVWPVPAEVVAKRHARIREYARTHQKPVQQRTLDLAHWTMLITSVPVSQLSMQEAQALLRARWQIELLFKLWKDRGLLDTWGNQKPERVLCELYAKLLAMLIQHWLLIISCWDDPHRSLMGAAQVITQHVSVLAHGLSGHLSLRKALSLIAHSVRGQCSIPCCRSRPNTSRLLFGLPAEGLT